MWVLDLLLWLKAFVFFRGGDIKWTHIMKYLLCLKLLYFLSCAVCRLLAGLLLAITSACMQPDNSVAVVGLCTVLWSLHQMAMIGHVCCCGRVDCCFGRPLYVVRRGCQYLATLSHTCVPRLVIVFFDWHQNSGSLCNGKCSSDWLFQKSYGHLFPGDYLSKLFQTLCEDSHSQSS